MKSDKNQGNQKLWIIGCGDIGRRVAKLYQNHQTDDPAIYAVVRSNASLLACREQNNIAKQADFDHKVMLPDDPASKIFYFMPPPASGMKDTRIENFLNEIGEGKKRIVLISTTGVYGDSQGEWIDEKTQVNPKAERAHRRLSAEQQLINWAKKTVSEYIILRVPGIYAKDRLPLARLKKQLPIVRAEEAGWTNRIHADDLAQVCKIAMESACHNEIINACDGNPSTMTDYFNQVADYSNLPRPPQISMAEARETLSSGMLSYLSESRRISNKKMLAVLKVKLQYPDLSHFILGKELN